MFFFFFSLQIIDGHYDKFLAIKKSKEQLNDAIKALSTFLEDLKNTEDLAKKEKESIEDESLRRMLLACFKGDIKNAKVYEEIYKSTLKDKDEERLNKVKKQVYTLLQEELKKYEQLAKLLNDKALDKVLSTIEITIKEEDNER